MGFFDTTSGKTKQTNKVELLTAWTSGKCCRCERHQGALFFVPVSPPVIRPGKLFLKSDTAVTDMLSDGKAAKICPVIWRYDY